MVIFSKLRRGRFPRNVEKLVMDLAGVLPHVVRADGQGCVPASLYHHSVYMCYIDTHMVEYSVIFSSVSQDSTVGRHRGVCP